MTPQPRVVTKDRSTLLYDAARHATPEQEWFERDYWQQRGAIRTRQKDAARF